MKTLNVRGTQVLVCDCHYKTVKGLRWYMAERYAARQVKTARGWRVQFMHRLILNPKEGKDTDHINQNPTDNRCSNLRAIDRRYNKMNAGLYKNNTSGLKGVSKHRLKSGTIKWKAIIGSGKSYQYLGLFETPEAAASAYNQAALASYGEIAYLNDIY